MSLPEILERSPRLALYLADIQAVLALEAQARQRYLDETGDDVKAEFINGEVVMNPPARLEHVECEKLLLKLLDTFASRHRCGYVGHEKLTVSLTRNDYEPDIAFWSTGKSAGFKPDQVRFPAPDFIVEILSPATEARERGVKMDDYAAHGVAEYWLVDPARRVLEQYLLAGDRYELALKSGSGEAVAQAIPGFRVPIAALFDVEENLAALRRILA
ncbi:MAG: Uma2 family endonuclease [Betaproteobacteria bacterium]|nr:Uma2 family endonuclease [Betaproteobacteria bacterium]